MNIILKIERKAATILFVPHDSNFLANGYRMKDINKAKARGMITGLAKVKIAKSANIVAIAKNIF